MNENPTKGNTMNATTTPKKVTAVRPDLGRLVDEIKRVVYAQKGLISVTEAIGALEIAKLEILKDQK